MKLQHFQRPFIYSLIIGRITFPILLPAWGITDSDGFQLDITAVERGRCFLSKEK